MTFLEVLILWALKKIKNERTVYSVFHLLNGKKSSQTIQDAYLYQIESLFYTFPHLTRTSFDTSLKSLVNQSLLRLNSDHHYYLTDQGEYQLHSYLTKQPFPAFLNGMKYQDHTFVFWNRLAIFVQILSNLINENRHYFPISRDAELLRWVKQFMISQKKSKRQLATALYEELHCIFSDNSPDLPEILVLRLTGYKQIGKTVEQTASKLKMETTEYWYRYLNLLHYLMDNVLEKEKDYPLLFSIFRDMYKPFPMTKSTFETYKLLLKNYSIADISKIRKLKESTIQDHIIEVVFNNPDFSIKPFVDLYTEEKIITIAKQIGKQKLKPIKDQLQNVSYFQIRLTLAKNR